MQHEEFIGQVQHRARLATRIQAEEATRATLATLAERLAGGAAGNLAAQLAPETAHYMQDVEFSESFGLDEFFERVRRREGDVELPEAVYHARAVISVLRDAVSPGSIDHVRDQLPDAFDPLFDSGSEGRMDVGDR
jgi:uncharacterized protein (DUF2267 family)